MHTPVLLQTVINSLDIKPNGKYIDATYGEGGYSKAIADKGGFVLAIDLDEDQIEKGKAKNLKQIKFVQGNFADIEEIAKKHHFKQVDGVVFDLGLSMEQITKSGKGLSYKALNESLDMRLDNNFEYTAEFFLNTLSAQDLYNLFARNSEEVLSQEIANSIVRLRVHRRIRKVQDLVLALDKIVGKRNFGVYARIFQALRIKVNHEFENLELGLKGALQIINSNGKVAVVTFHSLEDRIVKQFIKKNHLTELQKLIKGDFQKSFERSAKLRVFSK